MIHLQLRTEYSFRGAYGRVADVLRAAGGTAAGIADGGTWGHAAWVEACKAAGVKPLLGVRVNAVRNASERARQTMGDVALIALTRDGLEELYATVSLANAKENFYFVPRVDYGMLNRLSSHVVLIAGDGTDLTLLRNRPSTYLALSPASPHWNRTASAAKGWSRVVCCDNRYPTLADRDVYEIHAGRDTDRRTTPQHILNEWELRAAIPLATDDDFLNAERIAAEADVIMPRSEMVRFPEPVPLLEQCMSGARERGLDVLADERYSARLTRELNLIAEKNFEDYFYVIADLVRYAKQHMLVGPARGSSAGSLVCFLLGITDVDPLVHDLMFERFIDVTRADLPDIDIDFQDTRREMVYDYLREKYGPERVGRLGTILTYKAKSALDVTARELAIPTWELKDLKGAIVERSTGDARAQFNLADTFDTLDIGKAMLEKYPSLRAAAGLEGHAQTTGTHAAGVVVSQHPLTRYCARGTDGVIQVDKHDAETLNMLKIDVLGLRTLSVIQDCLDQIGHDRTWLVAYPLDDTLAFEIFNDERWSGIFQFEGYALQSLTRQMKVHEFNDIVAITALARPGPLHCGAATEYIERRIGRVPVQYLHTLAKPLSEDTYGTVIYQEQVMSIGRVIGQLSWEDVSSLRKAMSKSLGEEFFNTYWVKFLAGASAQGLGDREARGIWDKICTFGSWAFNKSHAVSYGLLSYWCAVLKARWPLQYAAACLRNAMDEDQAVRILRDLVKEGFSYNPVDVARSGLSWAVVDGALLGGLTNIKGMGAAKAKLVLRARANGTTMTPGLAKLLVNPVTPYDDIFEGQRRFGDWYTNPEAHNIKSGALCLITTIQEPGEYVFLGRIKEKNLRDLNEYGNVVKRGGRIVKTNNLFLNLVVEDDSGSIIIRVDRFKYKALGKPLVETAKVGDWYIWRGTIRDEWRMVMLNKWRALL